MVSGDFNRHVGRSADGCMEALAMVTGDTILGILIRQFKQPG